MAKSITALVLACTALMQAIPAQADIITLIGDGFDVQYDTDEASLFGVPSLTADGQIVVLNPTAFVAQSTDGFAPSTVATTLTLHIVLHTGRSLQSLETVTRGDYLLEQFGNDDAPRVNVDATVELVNTDSLESASQALQLTEPLTQLNSNTDWEARGILDASILDGTRYTYRLNARLDAQTFALGDLAFIEAKTGLVINTLTNVPAPAVWWLAPLLLLGWRRSN